MNQDITIVPVGGADKVATFISLMRGNKLKIACLLDTFTEQSDPSAVIFDSIQAAKSRNIDVLICDTAGRLQNKKNLMNELAKMNRVIDNEFPNAARETLLVVDATTGKNAISQAQEFNNIAEITGLVLTKMDGTAKGGIVITLADECDMAVKFVGIGEKMEDLKAFVPSEFAEGIT